MSKGKKRSGARPGRPQPLRRSEERFSRNAETDLVCRLLQTSTFTLFPYTTLFRSLMASSVRLKPLNCSRLPCVYAQETLTFLLTQKKTCVKNYVQKE